MAIVRLTSLANMANADRDSRLLQAKIKWFGQPVNIVYFSGFLDLFGVSMIMPMILPYSRDLGASPTVAGILGSLYGALQLVSSPALGHWSDRMGRHFSLILCLLATGAGYACMGAAASIPLLFMARIPLGIFKHSQNLGKTFLADLVPVEQRSAVLGHFNAASSIGFIIGPMIGGHIAELPGGFQYVASIAGAIFWINAALVWYFLPEGQAKTNNTIPITSTTDSNTADTTAANTTTIKRKDLSSVSLKKLTSEEITFSPQNFLQSIHSVDWRDLWDLFLLKFLAGFSIILFRSNLILTLRQKFNATPKSTGYMMSYNGLVAALCGFAVGRFTSMYSSTSKVFFHMLILQCVTLFSLLVAPSMGFIFLGLTPLSFVTTTMRVVATDLTLKRGGKQSRGKLMGLSQSVMSLARMLSPFLAGVLQEMHVDSPAMLAIVTSVMAAVLIWVRPQDPEDRKKKVA